MFYYVAGVNAQIWLKFSTEITTIEIFPPLGRKVQIKTKERDEKLKRIFYVCELAIFLLDFELLKSYAYSDPKSCWPDNK